MKGYEDVFRQTLHLRMPVIIRVDGKAFHTWTRYMDRPFSGEFMRYMDKAALALCREIQGAKLAYIQSDEISVLLTNDDTFTTSAWFDNNIQKMVSVAAAIASAEMTDVSMRRAMFDARAFVLPREEVTNYFLWRQNDATRNSIQMLARSLFSHAELHGKNNAQLHDMCFSKGANWNDLPTSLKRGRCAVRREDEGWVIDNEIPIWKETGREYIEKPIAFK
jgi:tRNA(His) 5'-end guanylyltransferase